MDLACRPASAGDVTNGITRCIPLYNFPIGTVIGFVGAVNTMQTMMFNGIVC